MSSVTPDAVLPALTGASVATLFPALLGARAADWLPEPARSAEQVVVLLVDGLGWRAIEEHPDLMPTLAAMDGGAITTVVPSTTATALTSVATGLAPAQHGIVGYRMMVDGDVLNVLRWTMRDGARPPDPFDVQRHTAFMGREVPVVTRAEFQRSGFTQAHLRGARFIGWHTNAMLIEECVRCVNEGERVVYGYYPGVDTIAHIYGLHDATYYRELRDTDQLIAQLRAALPSHAALLVTSDHGQVHLERESWIELDGVAPLVDAMAGDGRFRYLYARKGAARELHERARDLAGDDAWVWSRRELLDEGLLGTDATGSIPGRIGDVVLASRRAVAFVDPAVPNEVRLRSGHGSLTADEMLVPLVGARGG
jgi:predicted AlkP superfamily pyrophosphatase or phosphodiesterase